MNLAQELTERGFIHQISTANLSDVIEGEKRTIYHGIDPSADSAHVGNMVVWMLLRHLAQAGHKIVFLVGGGTGMIGDPKPDTERQLKDAQAVADNVAKLKAQAEQFFVGYKVEFVDNHDWLNDLRLIDFLRDIGKHYTVNELIKKDAIATRLASDTGLSYTEFAYPLLQGYDYLQLFQTKGCTVQVGGSDQWGNIISGVELVRRKLQKEVFAVTVPLVVDKATGKKFGKSEGNAVWLDANKTSPYQFYQFWLNTSDESVVDYLKLFTTLPLEDIATINNYFESNPGERMAQKNLAFQVTRLVHGERLATAAQIVSEILFGEGSLLDIADETKDILLNNAPVVKVKVGDSLMDVLVSSGLATSKREARTFIESGAVTIAGEKMLDLSLVVPSVSEKNNLLLLKRGKKQLCILDVE